VSKRVVRQVANVLFREGERAVLHMAYISISYISLICLFFFLFEGSFREICVDFVMRIHY
jgi:hypothetical protein